MLKKDDSAVDIKLFSKLKERVSQKAISLSSREQMLAMGRTLMLKPKILADEPSLGLSPNYVDLNFDKLIEINKNGASILLVEQMHKGHSRYVTGGYVFGIGSIALEGKKGFLLKMGTSRKCIWGINFLKHNQHHLAADKNCLLYIPCCAVSACWGHSCMLIYEL